MAVGHRDPEQGFSRVTRMTVTMGGETRNRDRFVVIVVVQTELDPKESRGI
ncbi:MAG: hypothetical protein HYV62_07310 [Candidatus Rokubacteria bacterium]|nr:hypothetical protein [Candidatus Rokubacteria bacterium]